MTELSAEQIRRMLVTLAQDNWADLLWHVHPATGELRFSLDCSDFFDLATADAEPIESENDLILLEQCFTDLLAVGDSPSPAWLAELYAARRRKIRVTRWVKNSFSEYYVEGKIRNLFLAVEEET